MRRGLERRPARRCRSELLPALIVAEFALTAAMSPDPVRWLRALALHAIAVNVAALVGETAVEGV